MKFNVYSVQNVEHGNIDKMNFYTLRLVSEEFFNSSKGFVYKKFKDSASSIINKIHDSISSKKLFVEETMGIEDLLISQLKPLQAIDQVRRSASSSQYDSSSFCYFENRDGMNFATIEGMFNKAKGNIGDRVFFYDSNVSNDIRTSDYRNIIGYQPIQLSNSADTVSSGGVKNQVYTFDLITGGVTNIEHEDQEFEVIDKKTNPINSGTFRSDFLTEAADSFLIAIDSTLNSGDRQKKIGKLQIFIQKIVQNLTWIHINGDSTISVGDAIECHFPTVHGMTEVSEARLTAGNYLVAKCRHMITFTKNPVYTQSLELIKGSNLG